MKRSIFALSGLSLAFCASAAFAQGADVEHGKKLYDYWCSTCHGAGPGHPGTQSLDVKYKGKLPAQLEERTDLSPAIVKLFVRRGVYAMPFFRKTELTDADLEAVAAYLARNRKP
jgi:mono/diheme cytochrome c family protein